MKIRAGDSVVVIAGKDKGKTGTVLRTLTSKDRVVVGDINMRTKHIKATPQRAGQKLRYEASIHVSNLMIVDPKTKKRARIGHSIDEKGKKKRIARQSGAEIAFVKPAKKKTTKTADDADKKEEPKKEKSVNEEPAKEMTTKQPFWSRRGASKSTQEEGDSKDQPPGKEDHSIPSQTSTNRSSQRGS
jgi:large subunit ribosomal protein L24